MKYTFIYAILFFFQNLIINAQYNNKNNIGRVSYERVLNFENITESTVFIMYFDSNFSVFYEERTDSDENVTLKQSNNDEFDLSFDVKFNGSKYIVLTDFRKDTIQSQVSLFKEGKQKTFVLEEKTLKIKWNLIEEFKTISGFKAQKAIGLFRGRKYIAWFTNDIPIKYGPWKLNGLPGLILSVSDDKNEVNFYVKSISFPFNSTSTKSEYEENKTRSN